MPVFFDTMYHESTYHDFLLCSVNIFRLEIGASFFLIPRTTNQYLSTIPSSTLTLPPHDSPLHHYVPLTSYHPSSSRKYPPHRCLFRSPPSCSTYTALAPTNVCNSCKNFNTFCRLNLIRYENLRNLSHNYGNP